MRHTVFSILSRGHFRPVFETWDQPIIVSLKHDSQVGNKNQLGIIIFNLETLISTWKHNTLTKLIIVDLETLYVA